MTVPSPDGAESPSPPSAAPAGGGASGTTGRSVLRGGAWNTLAALLPQLFVLVVSAAAARALGPTLMGRASFLSFVEITTVAVVTAGLPLALMRTVASAAGEGRVSQTRGLLAWAWRLMALAALVGGAAVASGAVISSRDQTAWLLAGWATSASVLQTVPGAVLIGLQRWRSAATAGLATGALSAAAVVVLLSQGGGLTALFAAEAVATTVNLVWTGTLARRALRSLAPRAAPPGDLRRKTLRFAVPGSALVLLELIVWKRSEFVFLARYSPSAEIAQYSIAFAFATAAAQLPNALTSVTSSFATLHGAGMHERIRSGFARAARLVLALSLPLTAGLVALGPTLVDVVYGVGYERAALVFVLLLISFPILPLASLADAVLTGRGQLTVQLRAVSVAVPVNLVLAALLVPTHGAVGAAVANVCGQLTASVPVVVHTARVVRLRVGDFGPRHLLRSGLVAVLAGVAAAFADAAAEDVVIGALALLAGAAAFAVTWIVLASALRVLSSDDGAWLADALGHRLGPTAGRAVRAISSG